VTGDDDIVTWLLRELIAAGQPLTPNGRPDKIITIEQRARIEWGGKRPYVRRYPERRRRKRAPDVST
jgi:hypothetical protein